MPVANKVVLALILAVGVFVAPADVRAAGQGGLSITPATLTLSLPKGGAQQTAGFALKNLYAQPITLHFAFEQQAGASDNPTKFLSLSYSDLTIAAGESASQTITLKDGDQLAPGSHFADLVVTQFSGGNANVSVRPSVRMPISLVKQDGALHAVQLASLSGSHLNIVLPGSMTATVQNTGNIVAIPRGSITVTAPNGTVVRRGVLNTASQAVSPGEKLALLTPMHKLANAWLPGIYHTTVSYGLGGGQTATAANGWFLYVAWWHVLCLALLGAAMYRWRMLLTRAVRKKPPARHPPRKQILIGRNA